VGLTLSPNLPDGYSGFDEKVAQTQWYRDYLAQGITSPANVATLWLLGEDIASEKASAPLVSNDLGLAQVANTQGVSLNPDVEGQASFAFSNGNMGSFAGDVFVLSGSCVSPGLNGAAAHADFDGAEASGTAIVTHRYTSGATTGLGAIVMNKNDALRWNTVWMGFGWFDVHDVLGEDPVGEHPTTTLVRKILEAALPEPCVQGENPTDVGGPPRVDELPLVTALHANVPNPLNPTTTIHFDLAADGQVMLRVYDVSGRSVRTLWNGAHDRGRHMIVWNGLDDHGSPVASGVYLCRLESREAAIVRKMLLVR
jgi:FlgD Ig-like domain